ncbi:MAG: gliding motility-associated C-terminal domain-containing protein, partial [Bacteroidetes bacterium]|nr:gliding motility-associated C-terminal domain-containing protein [Bacteroidota bacterium]
TIRRNDCSSTMEFDSVFSLGVRTRTEVLNGSQCRLEDTVYFANTSTIYGSNDITWLWDYIDTSLVTPRCTTNTQQHLDTGKNCNYSSDFHGEHFYNYTKCDEIWMKAWDNVNGCADSSKWNVTLGKPDLDSFKYNVGKACIGVRDGYGVEFELERCYSDVKINLDSACKRDSFIDWLDRASYSKTCDTSGWVTLGVTATTGDKKVYHSPDTSDYTIDLKKICSDTLWIHRAFKVQEAPKPQFTFKFTGCIPTYMSGSLFIKNQPSVRWMKFNWDDGETDSIYIPPGTDTLPDFMHTYRRSGVYYPVVALETDSGCVEDQRIERVVGFYNDYEFDDLICPGMTVFFKDTVTYWNDTTQFWRHSTRPEKIRWIWDGAIGPDSGHEVFATFDTAGTYYVQMITNDKKNCHDTMTKKIVVNGVTAGIRDLNKKIICDDILQLLDSSQGTGHPEDSLIFYYWDFGDFKTPSLLKHPFHYYSSYGKFDVTHVVANTIGCADTTTITIEIDGPVPQFDIISDTVGCAPFTAEFQNNSVKATEFIWYFGDSSSSANTLSTNADTNVTFTYKNPGIYYIYLYAGDSVVNPDNANQIYFCSSVFPDSTAPDPAVRRIVVLPVPPADFTIDGIACVNSELTLTDQSDTIYNYFRWYTATDSAVGSNPVQKITVRDTGAITIVYVPKYDPQPPYFKECYDTAVHTVQAFTVNVDFDYYKDDYCPTYHFNAMADDDATIKWNFGHDASGDKNESTDQTPSHQFAPDKGDFYVCLEAVTPEGCADTACKTVNSDHAFAFFIPNVITPNGDGFNDNYEIELEGENYFNLSIFNRWGERIYYAEKDYDEDSGLNWDGTVQGTGLHCAPGTYFYVLEFREGCVEGAKIERYSGTVTLIR